MSKSCLLLLGSLVISGAQAQNPFCTNAVYKALASGVAGYSPASAFCYSRFPLPVATRTNTALTTTVTTTVATNTDTTTVNTQTETAATVTTIDATVNNVVNTVTITEQTTTLATTTTGLVNKRQAERKASSTKTSSTKASSSKAASTKPVGKKAVWSSLVSQASSIVGQICTCLETQATTTVTTTPTATATATASETKSVTATTFVTLTVQATATEEIATTTTTTSVETQYTSICAPTFTRPASASNGQQFRIQDNRFFCDGTSGQIGPNINQISAQQCYDACANNGNCIGFTYSPNYRYCQLKSPGTLCYCGSTDFIAGIKV